MAKHKVTLLAVVAVEIPDVEAPTPREALDKALRYSFIDPTIRVESYDPGEGPRIVSGATCHTVNDYTKAFVEYEVSFDNQGRFVTTKTQMDVYEFNSDTFMFEEV